MDKIEELINGFVGARNFENYNILIEEIRQKRLVCFFGAGLSLVEEYKSWGAPFKKIIKDVSDQIEEVKPYIPNQDQKDKLEEAKKKLDEANELVDAKDFLLAGNYIEDAINDSKDIISDAGMGDYSIKSFNDACVKVFHDPNVVLMEIEPYTSPYSIPAIYYLQYLPINHLITTNVEESFERVSKDCETTWNEFIIQATANPAQRFFRQNKAIAYIHGHVSDSSTLVMTKREYDEMYGSRNPNGAFSVLKKMANDYSVLFLGARLQKDETVNVILQQGTRNEDGNLINGQHYICVLQKAGRGVLNRPAIPCDYFLFNNGQYQNISLLLHQLVRDTSTDTIPCSWNTINTKKIKTLSDDLKEKLEDFIESEKPLDILDFNLLPEISSGFEQNNLLAYIYHTYSMYSDKCHESEGRGNGKYGWSICTITHSSFLIVNDLQNIQPLHNLPLGDTIYVIKSSEDNPLYRDKGEKISQQIENIFKTFYLDENSSYKADLSIQPRVRVIVFPLDSDKNIEFQRKIEGLEEGVDERLEDQEISQEMLNSILKKWLEKNANSETDLFDSHLTEELEKNIKIGYSSISSNKELLLVFLKVISAMLDTIKRGSYYNNNSLKLSRTVSKTDKGEQDNEQNI